MGRRLQLVHGETTHTLDRDEVTLGRDPGCQVMLREAGVAAKHATIGRIGGEYLVRADDAGSTVVRADVGLAPGRWWHLASGDVLELGSARVRVLLPDPPEPGARLLGLGGLPELRSWPLDEARAGGLIVGRHDECDVQLTDTLCSRRHAKLSYTDGSWWVADAGSSGGVFVRGVRVVELRLVSGDEIKIAGTVLGFVRSA
jgi:pSer/pThr/pTyr-binding forkhead associated (FHA) protein